MKVGDLVKFSERGDWNPEVYDLAGIVTRLADIPWKDGYAVEIFWSDGCSTWGYKQDLEVISEC